MTSRGRRFLLAGGEVGNEEDGAHRAGHHEEDEPEEEPIEHIRHLLPVRPFCAGAPLALLAPPTSASGGGGGGAFRFRLRLAVAVRRRFVAVPPSVRQRVRLAVGGATDGEAAQAAELGRGRRRQSAARQAPVALDATAVTVRGAPGADAEEGGEVAQDEQARPAGDGTRRVAVVQRQDEDGEADGDGAEAHRRGEVEHCNTEPSSSSSPQHRAVVVVVTVTQSHRRRRHRNTERSSSSSL